MATFIEWIQVYKYVDLCRQAKVINKKDIKRIAIHLSKTYKPNETKST